MSTNPLQIALEELKQYISERSRAEINSINYLESLLGIKPAKTTAVSQTPAIPTTPIPTYREEARVSLNPFIDFPSNPHWKFINEHLDFASLKPGERKKIFEAEKIQGYIYSISVSASDKNIQGDLYYMKAADQTTIKIALSYRNLYLAGFTQGIGYVKLALYDPTLSRFTFIYEPQFPGTPFKGKVAFYITNPTSNQQIIYTLDFNILQTT